MAPKDVREAKPFNNDKEEAPQQELPYCTGEIDFMASGKKRGKVATSHISGIRFNYVSILCSEILMYDHWLLRPGLNKILAS